ncbi:MAG: radical SAM protein, partial [Spirochaetota bacterium]
MKINEMKATGVAIYLTDVQKDLLETEKVSENLLQEFAKKLDQIFPTIPIYLNSENRLQQLFPHSYVLSATEELSFLQLVTTELPQSQMQDEDIDEVFFAYCKGVFPFLDTNLSIQLQNRHSKYLSQYSYSENLPVGTVPLYLSREFVLSLPKTAVDSHAYLLKNINEYDTEIFYQAPDLRQMRLQFDLSNLRSIAVTENMLAANIVYAELEDYLQKNPRFFRNVPSYLELEVFRGCNYACTYCPRQYGENSQDGAFMTHEMLHDMITDLQENLPGELTVCFGGMGEPFLHLHLEKLVDEVLGHSYLQEVIIETALYTDIEHFLTYLQGLNKEKLEKIAIIVNLPSLQEKAYQDLTGGGELKPVLEKLEQLQKYLAPNKLSVQI